MVRLPRRGPTTNEPRPTPAISAAVIADDTNAPRPGSDSTARPTVSGKKAEQERPARAKRTSPETGPLALGRATKATAISAGRASHTTRAGTRRRSAETSSRPTASAAQKTDSANAASAADTLRSSLRKNVPQFANV